MAKRPTTSTNQLDRGGKVLRTIGRLDLQQPGSYDPQTLMAPGKLATWLDPEGHDRIPIVENAGPNRVAEWNADGEPVAPHITGSAGHFGDLALRDQRPPGFR